MGKKKKVGKSRKDKFYHLAKETGYRSRSSFKLIQLNRKFQFLQKARALVDLCAAPGGWLQVASKFMPVSSLIIGVDLVAIKPIPSVVTLQEDITTEKCRQALRKELQTWKVDVVLNDGAPNVGASWVHDAYSQAHLTLMALKLACEVLAKGGWFITKVFRSRDYQPLLWIFQQFFRKVQATKPQASRNESAEIFIVCQGYLAPDKFDSKFFDPKFAFKEVEVQAKTVKDLVTSKKPKAEGYTEGDLTLYHRFTLMEFLKAQNPVDFLSKANEITMDNPELERHSATTDDIRECCKDIKVLGRKELRSLLSWRSKLRRYLARKLKDQAQELDADISLSSGEEEEDAEEQQQEESLKAGSQPQAEEEEEEAELERKLTELKAEEVAELKRKKKKILKENRRQRERIELKMDLPGVSIADEGETGMFSLKTIGKTKLLNEIVRGDMSSADAALEEQAQGGGDMYLSDEDAGEDEVSLASDLDEEDLEEIRGHEEKLEKGKKTLSSKKVTFSTDAAPSDEEENPLLVPLEEKLTRQERETSLWFGKDIFAGIGEDADEKLEIKQSKTLQNKKGGAVSEDEGRGHKGEEKLTPFEKKGRKHKTHHVAEKLDEENTAVHVVKVHQAVVGSDGILAPEPVSSSEGESSEDEREIQAMKKGKKRPQEEEEEEESEGFEVVPIERTVKKARILDPEGLALGTVIATSKKATRDLIDGSFSRYTFNEEEDELPEWFLEEEKKHKVKQLPVDRQMVEEYRQRWRELNARPIKKVAEAKARKKRRMLKKQEQAKKKAEAVVNTVDISEREKAAQLRSIYKKAGLRKEKREVTYLVAKKGVGRKVRRPAGVKGHFKVVDGRMKKDMRAQKRKNQSKKHVRKRK
ncbi:pre-rRNA 2'-O-ribose RNA methyltransferase FTSJ3 [Rhinatrema bivittatum]|uniref:pre-rRNA 2'-O-ribose RNA methyltransferase FTSJ3 n=1 Tax=Rhinatrema bivittatum TaxID=194408 RepID=UPI001126A849|nr:pre-rRNA 2'-O-ribose RNA methyltransferase FTSJ3 [Rhinatrema bivittatum]XP_029431065.1 pre-rRNA 2'-O-ribose RNA methyltransferase FTSJ3 [Rhinatrema bivittatum]